MTDEEILARNPRLRTAKKWADRFIFSVQILTGMVGVATGVIAWLK